MSEVPLYGGLESILKVLTTHKGQVSGYGRLESILQVLMVPGAARRCMGPTGVPHSSETATPPRTTIGP